MSYSRWCRAVGASIFAFAPCTSVMVLAAAPVLEEVIVSAQFRDQSLQDVPLSVSAISSDKIIDAGLSDLEDLQAYVPNLTITYQAISTAIFIRGIGSGINQGFEQSVGMYMDGVYYGRAPLAKSPFLDLSRVEVLRGPQNILYGKNSIAGAVSTYTADPSDDESGLLSLSYDPVFKEEVLDLMVSGLLNDEVSYRFATRLRQMDGYMENLTLDRKEPNLDEETYRLKLKWLINDELSAKIKFESSSFSSLGTPAEVVNDEPSDSTVPFFRGRTGSEILYSTKEPVGTGLLLNIESDESVLNNTQDYKRSSNGDTSDNATYNVTINVDFVRDGNVFTSTTGFIGYDVDDVCDCDGTAAEAFFLYREENYDQFSQELRWVSPGGETIDFIGGLYFQKNDLHYFENLAIYGNLVPDILNMADLLELGGWGDRDPNPLADPSMPEEILGIGDAGNAVAGLSAPRNFYGESTLWSAFLQSTWNIDEYWRATLGLRYTDEHKTGQRTFTFTDSEFNEKPFGEVDSVAAVAFGTERHNVSGERDERHLSPQLNVQWDVNDEAMVYFSWSRGFKSGGFDARSNADPSDEPVPENPQALPSGQPRPVLIGSFEYEEETATAFEIGSKTRFWEGRAELNMAAFFTQYEDLQVSIYDGILGFNVGNAAGANIKGMEFDGRIQLTDYMTLSGGLAYLDFEFTDFENAQCVTGQTPTAADGLHCDNKGSTNQFVAKWSGNLLLSVIRPISNTIGVGGSLDFLFSDDYNPSATLDPALEQDAYYKINARLGVGAIDQSWEVALLIKNLTDEPVLVFGSDVPTAYTIFGTRSHLGFIAPPRSYALQARIRW